MGPPDRPDRRADPREALVFAGGDPPPSTLTVPTADFVIAADSGLEHAQAFGVRVDLVIGDLDSVAPSALDAAIAAGVAVERHPAEKDATDLELALDAALDRGVTALHVIGIGGGRLDHFLANVLLLASPRYRSARIDGYVGDANVTVVHDRADLVGTPGGLCSLLPLGGPASGVLTEGLRYPLHHELLAPGTTRGISNEFLDHRAAVSLDGGVLLAVVPAARATDLESEH
jgi:thiamine pyrophosphokinase